MRKAMVLAMVFVFGSVSRGLEVKTTEKKLEDGSKSVRCFLVTHNVNYQLAFNAKTRNGKIYINGIGLLGGCKHYSKRGWWSGEKKGFFQLTVWDKNLFDLPVSYKTTENGVVFTFVDGDKSVSVSFKSRENDDKLAMSLTFSAPSENAELNLICYPGDFMLKSDVKRNRYAVTAKREIQWSKPPRTTTLEKEEFWIYYEDKNFDTSKTSYYSTCALLFNPFEVEKAVLKVENYVIRTNLSLSAAKRKFCFILWEFPGKANAKCLQTMRNLKIKPARINED
jgi:hypothetical protein